MNTKAPTNSLDAIDAALTAATPSLHEDGQRLAAAVLRLLAAGEPASIPAAAAAAGIPPRKPKPRCGPGPRCSGTTRAG